MTVEWWKMHPILCPYTPTAMGKDAAAQAQATRKEVEQWMNDATAEIERLRAEVATLKHHVAAQREVEKRGKRFDLGPSQ